MTKALRVLVVGSDGMIGAALRGHLVRRGHTVFGTTRRRQSVDAGSIYLDLANEPLSLDQIPDIDVAIICAAMSRFADCRGQPALARRVNVTAPVELARHLIARGARVVRLSSSAVFDCTVSKVRAEAQTGARSSYGQSQAEAEKAILALGPHVSILRLTKIVTPDFGLVGTWLSKLANGETIEAFADHTLCPMSLACGVEAATFVAEKGGDGIYQVSGASDISYVELGRYLATRIGVPKELVVPVQAVDKGMREGEVTPYTSMDTTRLSAATGFMPLEPYAVIEEAFGHALDSLRNKQLGERCATTS